MENELVVYCVVDGLLCSRQGQSEFEETSEAFYTYGHIAFPNMYLSHLFSEALAQGSYVGQQALGC